MFSSSIKRKLIDAGRFALTFLLAFSLTFYVQGMALAEGEGEGGGDSGTDQPEEPARGIQGMSLYYETPYTGTGWHLASNSWESIPAEHGAITKKGDSLAFKTQLVWSDGATSDPASGGYPLTWTVDNLSVATISSTGILTARENGTVTVTATCEGISVSYRIDVSGQNNESYVTAIAITDASNAPYPDDGAGVTLKGDLNQTLQLYARVTVYNPATATSTDYFTTAGSLSALTDGAIADLSWSVNDTQLGYVEPAGGMYRPVEYGSVKVTASSNAGEGGVAVTGSVWVNTISEHAQTGGNRPQSSLTVRVYYEDAPDTIVSEKTFSRDDMEALGTEYHAYTAIGNGSFFTASARGVLFWKVLEAAGANLDGISYFSFKTADSGGGDFGETVSYDMLFGQTRYYYPNFDAGKSTQGAVPVPPMLAIESNQKWWEPQADMSPNYDDITDGTCFRLLFGANNVNQTTTNRQIYWINTVNVVLAGAPPTENGNGTGQGGGEGDGGGTGGGSGTGSGDSTGDDGGSAAGLGTANEGGGKDAASEGDGGEGRWSVYQVMNPNASNVDQIEFDNPFAPYVLPMAIGIAVAGCAEAVVRYRRQKLPLRPALPTAP